MAGFWKKLWGTDEAVRDTIDMVRSAGDKVWYTSEEKADDARADVSEARAMILRVIEATKGSNLARRFVAIIVTMIWALEHLAMVGLSVLSIWCDNGEKMLKSVAAMEPFALKTSGAMVLVLVWYFSVSETPKVAMAAVGRFIGRKVGNAQT